MLKGNRLKLLKSAVVVLLLLFILFHNTQKLLLTSVQSAQLSDLPILDILLHVYEITGDRAGLGSFVNQRLSL